MYFVYSILMVTLGLVQLPLLLVKWRRFRKYLPGLRQRFGHLPASLRGDGRPTIWFHACSVGETLSAQPLVHLLSARFPEARFVFSTITNTGQEIAKLRFSKYGEGNTFFFPVDLASIGRRVIEWVQPDMMVIIDTEIWPNLLRLLHRRGVPVVLVNGRISAASFRHYRLFRPALRRIFQNYSVLIMKSEEDADRIRSIGAPQDKVMVTGNIKYDSDLVDKEVTKAQVNALEQALGLDPNEGFLIVAGSTHPGEEETLLEVLRQIRQTPGLEQTRLLIAPRHPDRFDSVAALAARAGFSVQRRSLGTRPTRKADVLILDTIGELATAYSFATVVFVGGTLSRRGGHSIMEPALYAKPIVIGPSMENFLQIIDEFRGRGGVRQISAGEEDRNSQVRQLTETFRGLLQDRSARDTLGRAAYSIFEGNRGAAHRTVEKIVNLFPQRKVRT
jgi:3-deoxy-D-manno-octulosonic-acid transferase